MAKANIRAAKIIVSLVVIFLANCCCDHKTAMVPQSIKYFDAHSHDNGILPYYAYADLEAFVKDPVHPEAVDMQHCRRLWKALVEDVNKEKNSRYVPGSLLTVREYGSDPDKLADAEINGALERVLTSTPWTEFDSAYAFRGTAEKVLSSIVAPAILSRQLCEATVLGLAETNTLYSEQFISFVFPKDAGTAGSKNQGGLSRKISRIRCFMHEPNALSGQGKLKALQKSSPYVRVLLLTSTNELGAVDGGKNWSEYSATGKCQPQELKVETRAEYIRN